MSRRFIAILAALTVAAGAHAAEKAAEKPSRGQARFEERIAKLPPEKQQQMRECRDLMQEMMPGRHGRPRATKQPFETLPQPVQDELSGFFQARKDAFEKLSPAAKEALKTHKRPKREEAETAPDAPKAAKAR